LFSGTAGKLKLSLRSPFDLMVDRPDYASWLAFLDTVRTMRFEQVLALKARFDGVAVSV
jgi:hypothetical protein